MKKFVLTVAIAVLMMLTGRESQAADCESGRCNLQARVRTVSTAPVRVVGQTVKAVKERKGLFPRLRNKCGK